MRVLFSICALLLLGGCAEFKLDNPFTLFKPEPTVPSGEYVKAKPAVHHRQRVTAPVVSDDGTSDGCAGACTPAAPTVTAPVAAPPKKRKGFFHRLFHPKDQ